MSNDSKELLAKIEKMIIEETSIQREAIETQWKLPLRERIRRGKAISGLCFSGVKPKSGNLIFTCEENNSLFRSGDILCFHKSSPLRENCIQCFLEWDGERYIEVSVQIDSTADFSGDSSGWIADEGYLDLSEWYLDALAEVSDTIVGRDRILPLILGHLKPSVVVSTYLDEYARSEAVGLNESQAESAAQALATDLAYLIQGPPGTGKTFVIGHIVRRLVLAGERVFVTSFTHRAINNALNKIFDLEPELPVCKIGHFSRADELKVRNVDSFADAEFASKDHGYAIGATPFATRTSRLSNVSFDTVIFDEASQITLPLALMGMLVGKRYIFVGDDKQLPPVVMAPRSEETLTGVSVFRLLSGRGFETMLDVTYRMNDVLTKWPSNVFYRGELRPEEQVGKRTLKLKRAPSAWRELIDAKCPAVFADLRHSNTTILSHKEAKIVCQLIVELIELGIAPSEICVVSPYRRQGREIRRQLRRALGGPHRAALDDIVIDTVERMQGQEREVVLVSLATSDLSFALQLAEFFFQPNRLNVTITRARTKLIVVGSSQVLKANPVDPEFKKNVGYLRDFLGYCTYHDVSRENAWQGSSRKK